MPPRRRKETPLAAVPDPRQARPRPPDLRDAVRAATTAGKMSWLAKSDQAMRALALRIAEEIERTVDRAKELDDLKKQAAMEGDWSTVKQLRGLEAMCDVTKVVGWLGPQLQGVLRDLGGTPAARRAMQADTPVGGRLAELRDEVDGEHDS